MIIENFRRKLNLEDYERILEEKNGGKELEEELKWIYMEKN